MNFNKYQLKEKSHRIVFNTIRQHEEISGADISRKTNYQPSTISYILKKLEKEHLIEFARIGLSQGSGKPPTLWRVSENLGYIIGLECLLNEFRLSVLSVSGKIIFQDKTYFNYLLNNQNLPKEIKNYVSKILKDNAIPLDKVLGIGVALPGLIDGKNGFVHYSRPFNIKKSAFHKSIESALKIPSFIINDANAGALGIKWFRNQKDKLHENFLFLTVNDITKDLGAGIIINYQLFDGIDGAAGELQQSLPDVINLIKLARKKYNIVKSDWNKYKKHEEIRFSYIVSKAHENDKIAFFILQKFAQVLVKQIILIIGLYNPSMIVLGGDITTADFFIEELILPTAKRQFSKIYSSGITFPDIVYSPFGIFSVSVGAAAIISREIYLPEITNTNFVEGGNQ